MKKMGTIRYVETGQSAVLESTGGGEEEEGFMTWNKNWLRSARGRVRKLRNASPINGFEESDFWVLNQLASISTLPGPVANISFTDINLSYRENHHRHLGVSGHIIVQFNFTWRTTPAWQSWEHVSFKQTYHPQIWCCHGGNYEDYLPTLRRNRLPPSSG